MECALNDETTRVPVIRTTSEDTRILYFLVMGEKKKRVAIVAQNISEENDERRARGTLTWARTVRGDDRP